MSAAATGCGWRVWTAAEDAALRREWPAALPCGAAARRRERRRLADLLGRQPWEVGMRARSLGLRWPPDLRPAPPRRAPLADDPTPCPHPPGSREKVAWLAARVRAGYRLWRAGDGGLEGHWLPPRGRVRRDARRSRKPRPGRRGRVRLGGRETPWRDDWDGAWDDAVRAAEGSTEDVSDG